MGFFFVDCYKRAVATICCCHGDVHTFTLTPGIHRGWSLPMIPTDTLFFFPLQEETHTPITPLFNARAVLLKCLEIVSLPGAQTFLCLHLCLPPSIILLLPSLSPSYMHTFSIFFLLNYTQTVSRPLIPETVPPWRRFSHISLTNGSPWPMANRHWAQGGGIWVEAANHTADSVTEGGDD